MNNGCSALSASAGQTSEAPSSTSSYHVSRSFIHAMLPPVCFTTTTCSIVVPRTFFSASSTLAFSGIFFPPRTPSSAVMTTRDAQSSMRPFNASGENPPKTTE
jgi:hypothetical protein